jgi:hypothetical protein
MSRYRPLADFLAAKKGNEWAASFGEIEERLGFPLPKSAYKYAAWWANQSGTGHSQTQGWRSVGWRTARLDLERKRVRFEREKPAPTVPAANNALFEEAASITGITDRDLLIEVALRTLVQREAARHLIAMGGANPDFEAPPRRRPPF